jgi:hypothetical protein
MLPLFRDQIPVTKNCNPASSFAKTDFLQLQMVVHRKSFLLGFLCGCISILVLAQFEFTKCKSLPQNGSYSAKKRIQATGNISGPLSSAIRRQWSHSVARDHPHAGARDKNGAWNYVPDVEEIRRNVLQRIQNDPDSTDPNHYLPLQRKSTVCQEAPGEGFERLTGYRVLREYVQLDGPDPLPEERAPAFQDWTVAKPPFLIPYRDPPYSNRSADDAPPRVLCGVYTHKGRHRKVEDVADTWGWRCDGFFAASTKTDRAIGAVDLPHQGPEEYGNMWQKTRSMVAFMYDYYLEDYDYFLLCGDDTFIILENLRNYLLLLESESGGRDAQPLYIGMPYDVWGIFYNLGGSSYILNRSALRRLVEEGLPYYFKNTVTLAEDAVVGSIMQALHIHIVDTADAADRQRFFNDPLHVLGNETVPWLFDYLMYNHGNRKGRHVISTQSVGFHKIASMKRFSAILYNACPMGTVLGDAQNSTLRRPGFHGFW